MTPLAPLALSVSFLTVLPAPRVTMHRATIAQAAALFPVVGIGLGAALGGLGLLLDRVLPPGPVAVLLLAAGTLLTGALHLDGLIDTADGVFGGTSPARRLEIMRDSRIGAFGALAGGLALLGQYACLQELAGMARLTALTLALGLSRWVMTAAMALFPAASSSGLGATFQAGVSRWPLLAASVVALALAVALRPAGLAALAVAVVVVLLGGWWLVRRLGGLSGDTYGALAVLGETAVLFTAIAVLP